MVTTGSYTVRDRKTVKLGGFMGADYSSSPLDVAGNRATRMRNFINENGVNKKRNGWKQVCRITEHGITQRINGLWHFSTLDEGGETQVFTIAHAGSRIYLLEQHENSSYIYQCISDGIGDITDERSYGIVNNGKLYLFCGEYLVFGQFTDSGSAWQLRRVYNDTDTFIPTTTFNIGYEGREDDQIATKDKPNLLRTRRINSFEGKAEDEGATDTDIPYFVDCRKIDPGAFIIRAFTYDEESAELDEREDAFIITGTGAHDFTLTNIDPSIEITVLPETGKLIFSKPIRPLLQGNMEQDAFTIEFEYLPRDEAGEIISDYHERITKCTIGAMFGVNGVNDRLFIAGNPKFPNICFNSGAHEGGYDFTYFEDDATAACGSDSAPITAFSRLGDGTLAIHKKSGGHDANIYFREGAFMTNSQDFTDEYFPLKAGSLGEGVISPFACANLSGDNLILSENGVYGIVLSSNIVTDERYARERSRFINAALTEYDLTDAAAIVYKNKYYVSVGGECFIADARYTYSESSGAPDSYNYEWWHWDNVDARVWAVIDDKLFFGKPDGCICTFDKEYVDRSHEDVSDAQITIDTEQSRFIVSNAVYGNVTDSDRIVLQSEQGIFSPMAQRLRIDDTGRIFILDEDFVMLRDGQEVFVYEALGSGLIEGAEYTTENTYFGDLSFDLFFKGQKVMPASAQFKLCVKLDGQELQIVDPINSDGITQFQVSKLRSETPLKLILPYTSPGAMSAILNYRKNVIAVWFSAIMDLGTNIHSKTLKSLSVSTEPVASGKIEVGYRTRNLERYFNAKGARSFDFNDVDFSDFSFEVNTFASNYTKQLHIRNFNYIQIKLRSDNDKFCAVNNLTIEYTVIKKNKGVR